MDKPLTLAAPPTLRSLEKQGDIALFLDFDGTLVDIAPTPDSIHVPEGLSDRLMALAQRLHGRLALISGRSLDDLQSHVGELSIPRAGSHGLDRMRDAGTRLGPEPEAIPDRAAEEVINFAANFDGLEVETKLHGVALHYRAAQHYQPQVSAFAELVAGTYGLGVKRGKCVVELVHPDADKAGAVQAFMADEQFAGARPIFIGDDITDEDGFRAVRAMGGIAILVGERLGSCANYSLSTPARVLEWLEL